MSRKQSLRVTDAQESVKQSERAAVATRKRKAKSAESVTFKSRLTGDQPLSAEQFCAVTITGLRVNALCGSKPRAHHSALERACVLFTRADSADVANLLERVGAPDWSDATVLTVPSVKSAPVKVAARKGK